jgi:hypothetical protein
MNTVICPEIESTVCPTFSEVLTSGETAFIGECGTGPEHSLYFICYELIVLASNPQKTWRPTWRTERGSITIDRYVDVIITVKEK